MPRWPSQAEDSSETQAEIDYVRGLGTHCNSRFNAARLAGDVPTRLSLLMKYLRSMGRRARWGDINPEAVRRFVLQEIGVEIRLGQLVGGVDANHYRPTGTGPE
jgi:hypothetical protein